MKLTNIACKKALPKDKPYKISDGGGVYLYVMPNGSKYWHFRYRYAGKEKRLPLGDFHSLLEGYCAETGIRNVPSRRTIESRLEGLGYSIRTLHGKKAIWGLRALEPDVKNVLEPKI